MIKIERFLSQLLFAEDIELMLTRSSFSAKYVFDKVCKVENLELNKDKSKVTVARKEVLQGKLNSMIKQHMSKNELWRLF